MRQEYSWNARFSLFHVEMSYGKYNNKHSAQERNGMRDFNKKKMKLKNYFLKSFHFQTDICKKKDIETNYS
jgi:hypothetical protein